MKKSILSVLTLASVALVLAACGGSKAASDQKVTLSYASWDTEQAVGLRKVLDEFEKQNPNVKVQMETTPWDQYWMKLEAATTGGNMADVVTMHSAESYKYMSADVLMNLDDVVKDNKIDMNQFTEGIENFYTYEESLYGIPKDASSVGLWYNKQIFDDAGVAYPDETWNWAKLREAAIQLTDESKGIHGFAADNAPETGYWPFIFQNEGKVFNNDNTASEFNTPEVQEALAFYRDLILKDKVSPSAKDLLDTDKITRFQSGKIAMIVEGNWQAPGFAKNEYTKENVAVSVLPKGKVNATITNGLGWSASANTKHPEETKKLIAFLASEEANKLQAETGASIPAYKGFGDAWVASISDFDLSPFSTMLDYGVPRPFNKFGLKSELFEKEEMNKILSGEVSVEEGTKVISEGVNNILNEE